MASSTGNLYTTVTEVLTLLPDSSRIDSRLTDNSNALITQTILDVARSIDTWLPGESTPFPATTDTPDTPEHVQTMCKYLAAEWCNRHVGVIDPSNMNELGQGPWEVWVMAQCKELTEGKTMALADTSGRGASVHFPRIDNVDDP